VYKPIPVHVFQTARPPDLLGIYQFLAVPRIGENIKLNNVVYSVERVDWMPAPDSPHVYVRSW